MSWSGLTDEIVTRYEKQYSALRQKPEKKEPISPKSRFWELIWQSVQAVIKQKLFEKYGTASDVEYPADTKLYNKYLHIKYA